MTTEIKSKLVMTLDSDTLRIADKNEVIDDIDEIPLNITENNFYVMYVIGLDVKEFEFTTKNDFEQIVNNYINEFELTPEEIHIKNKEFTLDNYLIKETFYELDGDICQFCLYHITLNE
jgi:hypothetical protein